MTSARCPACDHATRLPVWEASGIPVRACTAPGASRERALTAPRGDIRLVACPACGLVTNEAFQPSLLRAAGVEEPVLARGAPRRAPARVGAGGGPGGDDEPPEVLGLDAAALEGIPGGRVGVFHSARLGGDVACFRFVLEHLPEPRPFLRRIRRALRERAGSLAYFEVPDGRATLERASPWELGYERPACFSLGSLARLLRCAGFDIVELADRHHERTLAALVRPIEPKARPTRGPRPLEDDLEEVVAAARAFRERARPRVERWRALLAAANGIRRVVAWGAGDRAAAFLAAVGEAQAVVERVVDVDPARRGARLAGTGQPVVGPADLTAAPPGVVVVMNDLDLESARRELRRLDLDPFVVAA